VKYEESDSPKSCHDFRNRGAFLSPEITELSANKIVSRLQKARHDLTASGPEISFFRKCDFHHFARKIQTVNPFSMPFSPTHS